MTGPSYETIEHLISNTMKKFLTVCLGLALCALTLGAQVRENIWPKGKMPHQSDQQIAAMLDEASAEGFNPKKHRTPYLEWFEAPAEDVRNGSCMILISGGGYYTTCDMHLIDLWHKELTKAGVQCVNFVYRTPRQEGLAFYQTAWEDGQRAVRMVRSQAGKRGFDPERIGVIGMSAGGHLTLLLATSSQTPAYERTDALDDLPCHINIAVANAPAYATTDADKAGTAATRQGYGTDVALSPVFKFDAKTCPLSLHHGGNDPYSPNGSTQVYRQLRRMKVPAELHLYPDKPHGAYGLERGIEFLRQMGFLGEVAPEVDIMSRFNDDGRAEVIRENVWPEGKMPDASDSQCQPYIEWHIPKVLKTTAIQIIYSGGAYQGNDPDGFEVVPARRFLNDKGMTVVTMKYRTPATPDLSKHTRAWQDLQRAVRIVRSEAASRGLDPDRIGIMGSSAGGHLTLMGVTSSMHMPYEPIDDLDKLPCNVQWGVGIYPAYALTDGLEAPNTGGGNDDSAVLAPEFSFDLATAPMLFVHGDADGWASMNSVKTWEKLRSMGIQGELHTLATRQHCFQRTASPGTGSYTYLDRIWEFLLAKGFLKDLE